MIPKKGILYILITTLFFILSSGINIAQAETRETMNCSAKNVCNAAGGCPAGYKCVISDTFHYGGDTSIIWDCMPNASCSSYACTPGECGPAAGCGPRELCAVQEVVGGTPIYGCSYNASCSADMCSARGVCGFTAGCNAGERCSYAEGFLQCIPDTGCSAGLCTSATAGVCGSGAGCSSSERCCRYSASHGRYMCLTDEEAGEEPAGGDPDEAGSPAGFTFNIVPWIQNMAGLASGRDFTRFTGILYRIALPIAVVLGMIMVGVAGLGIMTSEGDPSKAMNAKNQLTSAIIGLLFVLLGAGILRALINTLFTGDGTITGI